MNKKALSAIGLIVLIVATTLIAYKSLENLQEFELDDPFETELFDEEYSLD